MSLLTGLVQQNVDRHTSDMITLVATGAITTAVHRWAHTPYG